MFQLRSTKGIRSIMSFTIKIALQPFEVSFEAGSVAEAVAILEDPQNELSKLAALAAGADDGEGESAAAETTAAEPAKGKRGRKPKAAVGQEVTAPAPIPVGSPAHAPAPAPVDTGIPPFLDRTNPAAVVAAPPPPPAPAPVAPPPAPPVGQLSGKVIADLKKRAEGQPDSGAALVAWLATAGLVVPGVTFDEALLCIGMLDDAKLGPVATQLGVS